MMSSKDRFRSAIDREDIDRVPIGPPFQGYWALGLAGVKVKESIDRPELSANAQMNVVEACGFDSIETMWDWLTPVEALGCEVKIPEYGTIPTWTNIVNAPSALDKLQVPDPREDYRLKAAMKTTDILTQALRNEKYLMMTMVAPFTLAGELRGVEAMMLDGLMDPDFVRNIVNFSTETVSAYLEEMTTTDVDAVIMADPTASGSLISKEDFQRFSQMYIKECGRIAKDAGKQFIIHICGDTSDRLGTVAEIGADVFSIDYQVDIATAIRAIGNRQTILGNVKPAQTLFSGTRDDVWNESLSCIKKGGKRGFILGAGCDIAPGTPLENVQVWKEVVKFAQ